MSENNQDYDNQNEDSQNYDGDNQYQEYDSQGDNSQDNGDDDGNDDDEGGNDAAADDDNEDDGCNNNDDDDNDDDDDDDTEKNGHKFIRLRGLPWSATHKEILDFLKNINVVNGAEGIHIVTRRWDGVNSGEAYVELKTQKDADAAMKLDNATMGYRYIEVFNASPREAKGAMRKASFHRNSYVVKLRGLPFSITEQQVETFFNGLEIKADREGLIFVTDRRGRATGEAFVQFESQEDTEQALERNRQKIGHRYIEIFRSSLAELKRYTSGNTRMVPYDLKDRGTNRGNGNDFGVVNNRNNRWGNNGGFGVGANNTLGFNNLPNFGNSGNFGNNGGGGFGNFGNFGNNGRGPGGGVGNFGNFGNNGSGNFGNFGNNNGGNNFGNNSGNGNSGNGGGFNRFGGNSGNFGNDFGDFGNFGNDRGNNGMGGSGKNNMGGGGGFNNFSNFGNCGGNNMGMGGGLGSGFCNNMAGMSGNNGGGGGNFGPIGGGRTDEYYMIMMRGLPFSSYESDVYKFFEPLHPVNVRIHYSKQNGRHNGTAEALFENFDDAQLAMKRHRCKMGARYIELFFTGKKSGGKGGNNYSTGGSMSGLGNTGTGNGIGMGGGGAMGGGMFSRRI